MVIVLIIAAVFALVSEIVFEHKFPVEAIVIFVIIVINLTISFIQEFNANKALLALKQMTTPLTRVLRNNEQVQIPTSEIVVGDIVYLEEGNVIPADLRLFDLNNFRVQESSLTGESISTSKNENVCDLNLTIADRTNIAYASTVVTHGNSFGVVIAIGKNTEIGKIASMIEENKETIPPLKRKLNKVAKILSLIGAIVCLLILIIGSIHMFIHNEICNFTD
jgi:Ca2+-transporting ATPase